MDIVTNIIRIITITIKIARHNHAGRRQEEEEEEEEEEAEEEEEKKKYDKNQKTINSDNAPCGPSLKRCFSSARRLHLFLSVCSNFEILSWQNIGGLFGL